MFPTIEELVKRAHELAPDMTYTVQDHTLYSKEHPRGRRHVRVVTARSKRHGLGSEEEIGLNMGRGNLSDKIISIECGLTSLYWQVAPLQSVISEFNERDRAFAATESLVADAGGRA